MRRIMLLFLSDLHLSLKEETKGQLLAFPYRTPEGKTITAAQTNEPVVKYVMDRLSRQGTGLDRIFYFATSKVRGDITILHKDGTPYTLPQEQYFRDRIHLYHGGTGVSFCQIPYDEDKPAEEAEAVRQVITMAEEINRYLEEDPDKEGVIYADMTGGFRHAAMMMLSVMQLLKYRGATIAGVYYSNFPKKEIEDVTELHRMFSLVSGADEFANFGSVREISQYFQGRETSSGLRHLLTTMREFADAVRICRTADIGTLAGKLARAMQDFHPGSLPEMLFQQIVYLIRKEYGPILSPAVNQLDIIGWCVEKDFLQQAMTLCTEWLPAYFVDKEICYTHDEKVQKAAEESGRSMHRDWKKAFIINYVNTSNQAAAATESMYQQAVTAFQQDSFHPREAARRYAPLQDILEDIFLEAEPFEREVQRQGDTVSPANLARRFPHFYKVVHLCWSQSTKGESYSAGFGEYLLRSNGRFLRQMKTLRVADLAGLFHVKLEKEKGKEEEKTPEEKVRIRMAQYRDMFARGIMKSKCPRERALKALEWYQRIQKERNEMNHASEQSVMSNENVKDLIRSCLSSIRSCLTEK